MPRLYDRNSVGTIRENPQVNVPRVVNPPRNFEMAEREQLGQTVSKIGLELEERKQRLDYQKAKSQFLQEQAAADFEISQSDDWSSYVDTYRERVSKAKNEASGKLYGMNKERFELETDLEQQRGIFAMANKARAKENDAGMTELMRITEANRAAALSSTNPMTREALFNDTNDAIQMAVDSGYFGDNPQQKAEKLRQAFSEDYATAYLATLDPYAQLEALKNDKITNTFIPEDKRKAYEDRAKADIASFQVQQEKARKIAVQQAHRQALDIIESGEPLSKIPALAWNNFDGKERKALIQYSKDMNAGNFVPTDWNEYYRLMKLASNPASRPEFLDTDLSMKFNELAPAERKQLIGMQEDMREDAYDDSGTQILTDKTAADKAISALLGKKIAEVEMDTPEFANAFYRVMNHEMNAWLKQNPGVEKVPVEVRDKVIDDLTMKSVDKRSLFGMDFLMPDVEKSVIEEIISDLEDAGKPVNAGTIFNTYKLAQERGLL